MTHTSTEQELYEQWKEDYALTFEPNYDEHLEADCKAAFLAGMQATGRLQAVPIGWREQFATEVYADLEAADNQDVPLEEYPARILKVLDSIVGPRHPVVIKWRNDAIRNCIAIAYKYCRDPESHKYLKQDLEAMLASAPAHPSEGVPAQAGPVGYVALAALTSRTHADDYAKQENSHDL